ncbi:MAG: tRNA(Ile)(2)-agmatinylcytidine synthase [Candidatus Bathyarchaeia archaeon]
MMEKLHIGFDDTDSRKGGCTTYVAALIIEQLGKLGISFFDYPFLVRLNPNVPWKTRGNGALCLRILCEPQQMDEVKELVIETVKKESELSEAGTEPGIVFFKGEVPAAVEAFAERTITSVVTKKEALKLIKKYNAEAIGFKTGRGIIGGLAAIGAQLKGDHTFEFIAYRIKQNRGTPRRIDGSSVLQMDRQLGRQVFNNVDPETGRILITPRGPDPILYGIRGETVEAVKRGREIVVSYEPIERWAIFKTNQGTDAHLKRVVSTGEVKPFNPVIIRGEVAAEPRIIQGGHVVFQIQDKMGKVDCAAYEPTGTLRNVAMKLIQGDIVEVYGGVRPKSQTNPMTVNAEKIQLIKPVVLLVHMNPKCPTCGKRMKSMGKGQGFECLKCGFHGKNLKKIVSEIERPIKPGLYVTSPHSQRHLTKPLSRYGLEKTGDARLNKQVLSYELFYGH